MSLEKIREQIDGVDKELVKLFEKRMSLSEEVAKIKIAEGLPVLNKGREDDIIRKLTEGLSEEDAKAVTALYQKIFEISRDRQKDMMEKNLLSE